MERAAWFFLTVLWTMSAIVCAYGLWELGIWLFLGTGEEPAWFGNVAVLLKAIFGSHEVGGHFSQNTDAFRNTLEVAIAGVIAFAAGATGADKKSLAVLSVCTAMVAAAAVSYFLFSTSWAVYGGRDTIISAKAAFAAVARLNIILVGAHLGLKLTGPD